MPLTQDDVEFGCWLSASDHAALSAMALEAGMTQAQVVSALIGIVGAVRGLERVEHDGYGGWQADPKGLWVLYSDLTAAVGLGE